MKTQKIVVMGESRGQFSVIDIPATIVDVGSEFVTFVHRDLGRRVWAVSEKTTGNAIDRGETRKEAIRNATMKVATVGRDNMRFAVERQRNYLKEEGIVLV